jgi:PAX-interacting protein 1
MLKENKVNYFTYTPKDEKPVSLMIKNMGEMYEAGEIHAAIIQKYSEIKVLLVRHLRNHNWLVQLQDSESAEQLKKFRGLLGLGIRVEKYKGAKVLQCKNCQRYNHLAINCNMPHRCIKCTGQHEPGQCPNPGKGSEELTTIDENGITKVVKVAPAKCCNCGKDHPANFSGCEYRLKMVHTKRVPQRQQQRQQPQKQQKQQQQRREPAIPTNFRNPGISYSSVAQNVKQAANAAGKFDINAELDRHFGKDLNTCLGMITEFIPKYNSLVGNSEKERTALFGIMFQLASCQN